MTQAELQELVEKIRASEFRREALPAGADSISQAMPIKGLLDEKGELIPNWFDCADGFDKRYNWQIDGSPKRMIVRADINALGKIGIADSVRIVTGHRRMSTLRNSQGLVEAKDGRPALYLQHTSTISSHQPCCLFHRGWG